SMIRSRETCGVTRCRIWSFRSVLVKAASRLPHLFSTRTISWASIQKKARISSAPSISLAQNRMEPSSSCGRKSAWTKDRILVFTEDSLKDGIDVFEVIGEIERLSDLGLAQGADHILVGQQFLLEILALFPDLHGVAL